MKDTAIMNITLTTLSEGGEVYPFFWSAEADRLMQQLHVDFQAVQNRDREELKKYAFCIAAGAAMESNVTFDFTVDGFILACPHDWKERVEELITPQPPKGGANPPLTPPGREVDAANLKANDQNIENKEVEAAQSNETQEAAEAVKKNKIKTN